MVSRRSRCQLEIELRSRWRQALVTQNHVEGYCSGSHTRWNWHYDSLPTTREEIVSRRCIRAQFDIIHFKIFEARCFRRYRTAAWTYRQSALIVDHDPTRVPDRLKRGDCDRVTMPNWLRLPPPQF